MPGSACARQMGVDALVPIADKILRSTFDMPYCGTGRVYAAGLIRVQRKFATGRADLGGDAA